MTHPWIRRAATLVCSFAIVAALPAGAQTPASQPSETQPTGTLTAEAVNKAAPDAGDAALLRAQILLDRMHFSPGEIDGRGGTNTTRAIAGFQRHRGLEATGELDDRTWTALTEGDAAALVSYTLTAEDESMGVVGTKDFYCC